MKHSKGRVQAINCAKLKKDLDSVKDESRLFDAIVSTPFQYKVETSLLFLGIIVLLQINKEKGTIDRIALSNTELADYTRDISVKRFEDIKIPLNHPHNIIAQAVKTGAPQSTTDWKDLFVPELTAKEARLNQAGGAIAFSAVYPLKARNGGALIYSYYQYPAEIGKAQRDFMKKYSAMVDQRLSKT